MLKISAMAFLLVCSGAVSAQKHRQPNPDIEKTSLQPNLPETIWHDPGDVSSLNLIYGSGGAEHAPISNVTYTFIEEDMNGTNPKLKVKDAQGVEWKVKMGEETQAETAATRFLWAAGYYVDEDYFQARINVAGLPKLRRGEKYVFDGVIHGVRLERKIKGQKNLGTWDWFQNPFLDAREFNGLRVMMAFLNDWDLKSVNNSIYQTDGQREYAVTDVGATFGKTGNTMQRSKSDPQGYDQSHFVDKIDGDFVDFTMHSRPFFLAAVNLPNYEQRSRMEKVTKHIPRADAKWLGQELSRLSPQQIRDCFRSAGYTPEQVEEYTEAVTERIAALNAL